jgi:hypothetical protein
MERRTVIYFFMFKELKAKTVHTWLDSVYGPELFVILTVKKWRRRF